MSKSAAAKIALTPPQTIPLDKLKLHDGNVRHLKNGVSVESLAADIVRRGLLQSLSVRPLLDSDGQETGTYGVQAGGRRLAALQLLVKQKKLAKNAPVPCIVRNEGFVEADSLAENTEREALHPLDQFRAFASLRDKGEGEETIAAAFGVSTGVVKQRLRLANASPALLDAYEDGEITLDQLMAFCLVDNHERQEQVYAAIRTHWNKDPRSIRRMLTETAVEASDPRALFVGAEGYQAAGGFILRDLFDEDDGGWLQDVPLLERLTAEKLAAEAETIRAQEGWGWVEVAVEFPWNHERNFKALAPVAPALSEAEEAELEALASEYEEYGSRGCDDLDAAECVRAKELEALIGELEAKVPVFDEAQKAVAGILVSLREDGKLQVDRGYLRRDDAVMGVPQAGDPGEAELDAPDHNDVRPVNGNVPSATEDDDATSGLPDRLLMELTAYRSLALRHALACDANMAYLAVLHALALRLFYRYSADSSLQIEARDHLVTPFEGLGDAPPAQFMAASHKSWEQTLPDRPEELWDALARLDADDRQTLFAHCVGLTINAVHQPHQSTGGKFRHADQLATALKLDMTQYGWVTRADNFLGRLTKTQIIAAVTDAKGAETASLLLDLKKKEMAQEAERLIRGTNWLPEPLRTAQPLDEMQTEEAIPAFLDGDVLMAAE
jgi:ParB family chromosome partitioning protein